MGSRHYPMTRSHSSQAALELSRITYLNLLYVYASVVYWLEFLATDSEVPGLIPGATRVSEK
jgi:hypothetical protein